MTEQRAIEVIKQLNFCGLCTTGPCEGCERKETKDTALAALEEIQKYREIGSVTFIKAVLRNYKQLLREIGDIDKFREERDKQIAWPTSITDHRYICPKCKASRNINQKYAYCPDCGQKLAWDS